MNEYENNLERLELLKTFKGGDNEDVSLHPTALDEMRYIIEKCKEHNLPQPEIFPWYGGNGIQAEWEYDWYLEIDSSSHGVSILFIKEEYYDDAISISVSLEVAFKLVKTFLNHVVDLNSKRQLNERTVK